MPITFAAATPRLRNSARRRNNVSSGKVSALLCVLRVTSAIPAVKVFRSLKSPRDEKMPPKSIRRRQTSQDSGLVIVWEFRVDSRKQRAFERAYGPDGDWARFFQTGRGYVGTELIHDSQHSDRYLTLDYWESSKHYEAFKRRNRQMYEMIDERCEALTTNEVEVGKFSHLRGIAASRKPKA